MLSIRKMENILRNLIIKLQILKIKILSKKTSSLLNTSSQVWSKITKLNKTIYKKISKKMKILETLKNLI